MQSPIIIYFYTKYQIRNIINIKVNSINNIYSPSCKKNEKITKS
jgi:hypothetical protein